MKSQTSLVAAEVRLQQWAMQIQDCKNRPAGMDITTWCAQNNITRANYYYRLRRVRQVCLQMTGMDQPAEFIEVPTSTASEILESDAALSVPPAVLTLPNGLRIELSNSASDTLVHSLLKAACHAE